MSAKSTGHAEDPQEMLLIPASEVVQSWMTKVLGKIPFDAREICKILRFVVSFIEPGENAKDFARALSAHNRVGAGKPRDIESWFGFAPQARIIGKQLQFGIFRHIDARVLQ
jgi:hypothetical protein